MPIRVVGMYEEDWVKCNCDRTMILVSCDDHRDENGNVEEHELLVCPYCDSYVKD